jgi:hypothetical protein
MPDLLEALQTAERIPGGYVLARTDDYVVDVTIMMFNWRIHVALPEQYGQTYEHGYCYFGTGVDTMLRAVAAGLAWEDPFNTDPTGYDKKAF